MREIYIEKIRRSTAIILRKDFRRIFGRCMIEHMRVKDDGANSFLAGFATSIILGGNVNLFSILSHDKKITIVVRSWRWIYDVWILQSF